MEILSVSPELHNGAGGRKGDDKMNLEEARQFLLEFRVREEGRILDELLSKMDDYFRAWYFGYLRKHLFVGITDSSYLIALVRGCEENDEEDVTYMYDTMRGYRPVDEKEALHTVEKNIISSFIEGEHSESKEPSVVYEINVNTLAKVFNKVRKLDKSFATIEGYYIIPCGNYYFLVSKNHYFIRGLAYRLVILAGKYKMDTLPVNLDSLWS